MTDRELLQQALDALQLTGIEYLTSKEIDHVDALEVALRARLAQPESEPFEYWNVVEGWVKIDEVRQHFDTANCGTIYKHEGEGRIPLYAALPQREWVGLTKKERIEIGNNLPLHFSTLDIAYAIEAKLKEKNAPNL
jgi:hypothetical protein